MSQFKPGDLALVVGGETFLGMEVELIALIKPGDKFTNSEGMKSVFEFEGCDTAWLVGRDKIGSLKRHEWLIPLRVDFAPEQQKSREVVL